MPCDGADAAAAGGLRVDIVDFCTFTSLDLLRLQPRLFLLPRLPCRQRHRPWPRRRAHRLPRPGGSRWASAPLAARNWNEFRAQAANRLVQAHPDSTYMGPVAEPLLAIPVLEIELNADGSVRRVQVLRHPRQAKDTTQLAIDAVQRAAPYGSMTLLPRPWKWVEVFLFNDDRRFKPRELDH